MFIFTFSTYTSTKLCLPKSCYSILTNKMLKRLYHKLLKYFYSLRYPFFGKLKRATNGYLSPATYRAMYLSARSAPAGHIIDIGPAQGGSTIAYALGLQERNTTYKVYSIEKGIGSGALKGTDQADNQRILENNIKRYSVQDTVEVIMTYSHEAFADSDIPSPIGLLSIDADGALDRDFNIFYNRLAPGAIIVLDDVEDMINPLGKKMLQQSEEEIAKAVQSRNCTDLAQLTPLGKEYTTHRFVEYLQKQNLLTIDAVYGRNTVFAHKPENVPEFTSTHYQDMQDVRQQITADFWQLKRSKY